MAATPPTPWFSDIAKQANIIDYMSPKSDGGSDEEYVKDQYEDHWDKRLTAVLKRIEDGESVDHIMRKIRPRPHRLKGYNRVAGSMAQAVVPKELAMEARLWCAGGRYVMSPNIDPVQEIAQFARKASVIVELGAGPGWNLIEISMILGKVGRDKRYIGMELTDKGREVMAALGKAADIRVEPQPFDWRNPDISAIPDVPNVLIFSHHSMEQVHEIDPKIIDLIAARKHPCLFLVFEPIGWQRVPELVKAREAKNDLVFQTLVAHRNDHIDKPEGVITGAAINSWRTSYNLNAYPAFQRAAEEGLLQIEETVFDFNTVNNANPVNPTTYLRCLVPGGKTSPRLMAARAQAEAKSDLDAASTPD